MSKNLICKFWKHDWETIQEIKESDLKFTIEKRMGIIPENSKPPNITSREKVYERKVCLRCGTKKDDINDYFTKYLKLKKEDEERRDKATKLWSKK